MSVDAAENSALCFAIKSPGRVGKGGGETTELLPHFMRVGSEVLLTFIFDEEQACKQDELLFKQTLLQAVSTPPSESK